MRIVASGDYKNAPDPTCAPFEVVPCDVFITEATFASAGVSPRRCRRTRSKSSWPRSRCFPERAHLVGAYSLGKAQRVIALLRQAGYDAPIYLHGAMEKITAITKAAASRSANCARSAGQESRARRHHHAVPAVGH
jgi:putative mRNA 3-end processing factor